MKTSEEVQARLKELEADERLSQPPATVDINAPLALIQLSLETEIRTLKWALQKGGE